MIILDWLLNRYGDGTTGSIEHMQFNRYSTLENNYYRGKDEPIDIVFTNIKTFKRRVIVDKNGYIVGFPGIANPKIVAANTSEPVGHQICYMSEITKLDGRYALI